MSAALSADHLKARIPVWQALSEFWLDTELQDLEFNYIARVIAESPYSIEQVMDIHLYEVAPAVSANLASMAGEWAGFDKEWLVERCEANALRRYSFFRRARLWLQAPILWFFTARYWREIVPRVSALRDDAAQRGVQPGPVKQ
jgi:hypothetical protein